MESKDSESKEVDSKESEFKQMDAKDSEAKGSAPSFRRLSSLEQRQALTGSSGRRLSLVAADGSEVKRRQSTIAMSVQDLIRASDDPMKVLMENMAEQAKLKEGGEPEFASWGLSALGELVCGNDDNRKKAMEAGAKDLVLDNMAFFVDDVYVQWQGCQAIAQLGSTPEYAVQFGQDAIDAVLGCIVRTDVSELGATGCRSLKNLVQADGNMVSAKKAGTEKILGDLLERFQDGDPMFQYRGQMLLKEIADWEPDV